MLDFMMSKLAMLVAAVIILLAGIGLYEIQKNAIEDEELQNIGDKIAKTVNELNALNADTKVNLTFNRYKEGIYIKPTVGGEVYTIRITQNLLFLTQKGRSIASNFLSAVHVWKPDKCDYNMTELADLDAENRDMEINSGEDIEIDLERKQIEVSGMLEYHTFVYTS